MYTYQELELYPKPLYRAKTNSVSPQSARTSFEQLDSCFLGISLENANFAPEKLKAIVEWISRRFSHCLVLVGDSIHRITLETTRELKPHNALTEALELGKSFIQDTKYIFEIYGAKTKFSFETCSQIQTSNDYKYFFQLLTNFFQNNRKFQTSVREFARSFHVRKSKNLNNDLLNYRISRSCDYFLEEFAIFTYLQQQGFPVMVYPGTFSTLAEILNGKHPDIFEEIKQLTVVSLHFKKR